MKSDNVSISWAHGEFTILKQGAMCAPATFDLGNGRSVQPFAVAPWKDDGSTRFQQLPQLLKRLRGEWACVPFGMPEPRQDLPSEWKSHEPAHGALGDWFHGPGSNEHWVETGRCDGGICLELSYPNSHPIERLVRRITGSRDKPRLDFELEVHPRQDCSLPVGVHPVFRLPTKPGLAKLTVDGDLTVHTYPVEAEPGVSKLPHGTSFKSLEAAVFADGVSVDLTKHPLLSETEEIVLVAGVTGRATLDNLEDAYRVTIEWDPKTFGNCNLWVSNKGRQFYPWNGRFQALGIEPVSAPFDLGYDAANAPHSPLKKAGVACAVQFRSGKVWKANYSIGVSRL